MAARVRKPDTRKRVRKGQTVSPEARVWYDMMYRCHKPTHRRYKDYGAKGVHVCAAWRAPGGRDAFVEYMGPRPDGHELGRLDRTKGYEPGNCAWMTRSKQRRLHADVPKVDVAGERMALIEAAEDQGLDGRLVRRRVQSFGWDAQDALAFESGEKTSKLTPDKVRRIRALDAEGVKRCDIARRFDVSGALVSDICNGKKWASVQ